MANAPKKIKEGKRFGEILSILRKHQVTKNLTPEKLRAIFEDLGPTFVKFGQILSMRSDLMPQEYCRVLEGLRTDAIPMSTAAVKAAITQYCGRPWDEVFSEISEVPVGSASIAQVHTATLPDGAKVVVKVQRPDIRETMERDIKLMKRAAKFAKFTPIGGALDFVMVLDEMWKSLQEELDFGTEAHNLEEFRAYNREIAYVACPEIYEELSNDKILVMERIGGYQIDDAEGLKSAGYDLDEIATKLINNYIKQITVDRFFHADPHPGNIRVQDGKIVWLDLGMMGRLSKREAGLYMGIIKTIYKNDALGLTDVLLSLGKYEHAPDRLAVSTNVDALLAKYKAMSMADMNLGSIVAEFVDMLNQYGVSVPASLTMLGRSLLVIQGMLSGVSPDTNVMGIVADYIAATAAERGYVEEKAKDVVKQLLASGDKLTMLPEQASDFLKKSASGQLLVNVKQSSSEAEYAGKMRLLAILALCLIDCALILGGAILCLSAIFFPLFLGLPWPATVLFILALIVSIALIIKLSKK